MKIRIINILVFVSAIILFQTVQAQYLTNPSLEGTAGDDGQPDGWQNSPLLTGSDPNFYSSFTPLGSDKEYTPVDGATFTLYRARGRTYAESHHEPETREYSFQQLIKPLETYSCFKFEAYLAFNPHHEVLDSDPDLVNKSFPLKFQVWAGNGPYARDKLLVDSDPIGNEDWEKHTFYFSTQDIQYGWILFEVQWDTINIRPEPYNAYLLIDNLNLEKMGPLKDPIIDSMYYHGDGLTQLNASEGISYSWEPPGKVSNPDIQSPVILEYQDTFTVIIEKKDECPSIEKTKILLNCDTIYPNYYLNQREVYYKYEKNIHLEATEGDAYIWTPGKNLSAYDIQSPYMTDYTERYEVEVTKYVTNDFACTFREEFNIILMCDTLYPEKTILVMDSTITSDKTIQLSPLHGWPVSEWTPPEFISCLDCNNPEVFPEYTTTYSVNLEDNFGCSHQEMFRIEVKLKVPNVITPNSDGYNDCFKITGLPQGSFLYIYTKNGELLFSADPYTREKCWKGTDNKGLSLETGTYWYILGHPKHGTLQTGFIFVKR